MGSGYGAATAASRLARMGYSVAILERGAEILPGQFPKTLGDGIGAFQADLGIKKMGSDTALFDLRVNKGISVLIGCGVGGTTLINGNIMLRPDDRVFSNGDWPEAFAKDAKIGLSEGFDRANAMLTPASYPDKVRLAKLEAFKKSAEALGRDISLPPVTITYEDRPDGNIAGVIQPACTLCGDCCSGCNVGAKNTTTMNYVPDAVNHGAQLFTHKQVRHVTKNGEKWRVAYRDLAADDKVAEHMIEATIAVLGAGTLGSTEILLRSREKGLSLSAQLGRNFSGNGDVIAFGYNCDEEIDGIGVGHPPIIDKAPVGPVIAGLIDLRDTDNFEDGMVIQEGAIPSVLAPALPQLMAGTGAIFGNDTDGGIRDYFEEKGRVFKSLFGGAYTGAVNSTMTFLVMAHDGNNGVIQLDDGRVSIDWEEAGQHPIFKRISETLEKATAALGGKYVDNPAWSKALGRNLISVHPLGGCGMGNGATDGVVDHKCRVFTGNGTAIHDGLYVCDGSVMPRSLGVNPGLTITAVTERAMKLLAEDHGRELPVGVTEKRVIRQAAPNIS